MIRGDAGLTRRLSWALVGTVTALAALMALVTAFSYERIEHSLLDTSLNEELDSLVEWNVPPQDLRPRGGAQQYFRTGLSPAWHLPPELAALGPGRYHDLRVGDGRFHVLIRDIGPGDRALLLQDVTLIEEREQQLFMVLASSVALIAVLGLMLSHRIADVTLQPLRALVQRISRLDPERIGERLDVAGRDPDLRAVQDVLNAHMGARDGVVERERAFAAAAAHELRTPVAVIRASLELAQAQAQAGSRPGNDDALRAKAVRAVESLSGLIDALLQLSLSRRVVDPQPVDLQSVVDDVVDRCRDEAAKAGVRVVSRGAPAEPWSGSRGVASVVVSNLLSNAIRAAAESGERLVEIESGPGEVRIFDQGPGPDMAVASRIFEPGVSGRSGGTGMGLYIARELARRHGGEIALQPRQPGPGAVATWRLRR